MNPHLLCLRRGSLRTRGAARDSFQLGPARLWGPGVHLSLSVSMDLILTQCSSLTSGTKEGPHRCNLLIAVCGWHVLNAM